MGTVLSVVLAVVGLAYVGFVVVSVVRLMRERRHHDEMLNEYRALTDELVSLQQEFVQKYAALSDDERSVLWKPVSEAVTRSIECIMNALRGGQMQDPRPDLKQAVELARALVAQEPPTKQG